jgi:hypothetical protein
MERLAQLISKLNEQFAQKADPFQLLVTAQLIETELVQMSTATNRNVNSSTPANGKNATNGSKVSVVMPSSNGQSFHNRQVAEEVTTQAVVNGTAVEKNSGQNGHEDTAQAEHGWKFDPLREIPTLAHQQSVKELNEVMATQEASLNDKLKEEVKEVAHVLNDSPVRDLRRAIGINDRFVFISELFRNDEVMYERSIKTINSFRILPEAQYWIERELKVKLGWDENKESTRHFYQLVKRRFS